MAYARIAPKRYRVGQRRRQTRHTTLLYTAIAALLALTGAGAVTLGAWGAGTADTAAPASTPRGEWRKGSVPYLYQIDPAWSEQPYAGGTIGENGCGPTCLSMVYVALTGDTSMGPVEMAALSERGGHTVDGMTAWTLMTDGARSLGLESEELPASEDAVADALRSGQFIIASMRPGDFTTTGHFIVLAGLDGDGSVTVRDPNSEERSHESWELARVLGQCANLWALG